MSTLSRRTVLALSAFAATPLARSAARAQEPAEPISVYASGLVNPRGLAFGPDGALHVAQAGTGETGGAANVVRIENGCPVPVVTGLPSARSDGGEAYGVSSVAFLGDRMYVLQSARDQSGALAATFPNGLYAAEPDGTATLVADLTGWLEKNPTATTPTDLSRMGQLFAMLPGDGFLWVVEANRGQVLKITPDGAITRVADLSGGHPVPTGCAPAPDGGIYVANLTEAPYKEGKATVQLVGADGAVREVWSGLTMVTGLAVVDGVLHACEMATGNTAQPPFTRPGSGRVVRQTGPGSLRETMSRLDFPVAMTAGPDGMLYVSSPAIGSFGPAGAVLRIDPRAAYLTPPANLHDRAVCPGYREARAEMAGVFAGMTAAAEAPAPPASESAAPPPDAVQVAIRNFAYDPPTVTIPVGRAVTWTNEDPVAHTATSDQSGWDSGNLNQGQSWTRVFDAPGTFAYDCVYHPYMTGTVVVE